MSLQCIKVILFPSYTVFHHKKIINMKRKGEEKKKKRKKTEGRFQKQSFFIFLLSGAHCKLAELLAMYMDNIHISYKNTEYTVALSQRNYKETNA